MKKLLLFFLAIFAVSLSFAQVKKFPLENENFSEVVLNKKMNFEGLMTGNVPFKLSFDSVFKNPEKPASYFIAGQSEIDGNTSDFLGEMVFTEKYDVKGSPDQMLVFGNFYFVGGESRNNSGTFRGKFRIQLTRDLNSIEKFSTLTFKGKWKSDAGAADIDVWWANYTPADISKVIFK